MRRLALKNKRKTLETKEASSNSELDASEENGGSLESSAGNENSARGSKARKSRAQPESDTPYASVKYEEDSVDSNKSANEGTYRGSKAKRGRPSTTGIKTEENGDSSDSSAAVNEGNTRGSKARKSRGQSEIEDVDTPNKRKKRDNDDESPVKEAELVIDSRIYRKKKQYKIRWRNYGSDQDTWESPENVDSSLIAAYNAQTDSNGSENEGDNFDEPAEVDTKPVPQNDVYEVQSILAVRTVKNKRRYKVHWKGLSHEEDSWVSENKLSCPQILQDFLRNQKEKKNQPKPIKVDGNSEEYEVEKVIEVRFKKGGKREFLIRWKGFSSNDDTWEPEENLNCPDLITKFMAKVEKAKNSTSRELRANPVMTERLTLNMKSAQLRYSRRPQTQNRPTYHNYLV